MMNSDRARVLNTKWVQNKHYVVQSSLPNRPRPADLWYGNYKSN